MKTEIKIFYLFYLEVESNSDSYRNQFYEFLFEISEKKINKQTLEKYLEIEDGLSFFWFSNLNCANNQFCIFTKIALLKIIEEKKNN